MKKIIILFAFVTSTLYSQTSTDLRMFSSHYDNLLEAEITFSDKLTNEDKIYINEEKTRFYNGKKKGAKSSYLADNSNLIGVIFKIKNYFLGKATAYKNLGSYVTLELYNSSTGSIYFETYSKYPSSKLVLLTELELPPLNEIFCQEFIQTYDKFEGIKRIYTSRDDNVYFTKRIDKDDDEMLFINFNINGSTPNFLKKGVKIIFDDGEILDYPEAEIDVSVSRRKYRDYDVSATFVMNNELVNKMRENLITDFRLYIYENSASTEYAKELQAKFNCLIDNTYLIEK
jgi:hypothetical protein